MILVDKKALSVAVPSTYTLHVFMWSGFDITNSVTIVGVFVTELCFFTSYGTSC